MSAVRNRGYLSIAAAILVAGVLISVSLLSLTQGPQTPTVTVTANSMTAATYFFGQNVTLQVPQLSNIPESFVVGSYLLTTSMPQPCTEGGCSTRTTLTIGVEDYCPPNLLGCFPLPPQNVSFSWPDGFGQSLPSPANTSLHDGILNMDWTLESGSLFLAVWEYVHTSSGSSCQAPTATAGQGFVVMVNYTGPWNATIDSSAFSTTPAYLVSSWCASGTGNGVFYIPAANPSGESTVLVTGHKLDAGSGNLTVSVAWDQASRSNSTSAPYGTTSTSLGVAP